MFHEHRFYLYRSKLGGEERLYIIIFEFSFSLAGRKIARFRAIGRRDIRAIRGRRVADFGEQTLSNTGNQ